MNQLCHFLKQGFSSKAMSSPILMRSAEILQTSVTQAANASIAKSESNSWFMQLLSNKLFKTKRSQETSQQLFINSLNKMDHTQLLNINNQQKNNLQQILNSNNNNSQNLSNNLQQTDVAQPNNNNIYNKFFTHMNNRNQLQNQVQYNVISTKEFHIQKKNYTKMKAFLKEFALLLKEGTKDTYTDGKWYFNLLFRKNRSQMTGYEVRQSMRIRSDLFKIIPFSFFVIVPAAELLLPVYLLLFPNAMPSQYTFDYAYDQYIQSLEDNQASAHEALVAKLKTHLMEKCNASIDHFLHSDTYKQVFFKNYKNFETDATLDYTKFSSDDLITVCKFLGMECITGTYIISKILNIMINTPIWLANTGISALKMNKEKFEYSKFSLSLNFGPFEVLKRQLLLAQIKRHISLLRLQDQAFFKMGLHDIVGHRITDFARERGITTITCYETLKAIMANEWVNVCINRKFNDNAILWYAIMQYDFLRNANNDMN